MEMASVRGASDGEHVSEQEHTPLLSQPRHNPNHTEPSAQYQEGKPQYNLFGVRPLLAAARATAEGLIPTPTDLTTEELDLRRFSVFMWSLLLTSGRSFLYMEYRKLKRATTGAYRDSNYATLWIILYLAVAVGYIGYVTVLVP